MQFLGNKIFPGLFKDFMDEHLKYLVSPADKLRQCNGCECRLPARGDQFDSPLWLVFASRFTRFALGSSGA